MEVNNQPKLSFLGVDIVDIDFKSSKVYDNKSPIDFNVIPKVFYPSGDLDFFKIVMELELKSDDFFNLNMYAIGNFSFPGILDLKEKRAFINRNAPAIMFPYVRSFISTLTSNLGNVTGHLMIPTQFFKGELEEIKEEL